MFALIFLFLFQSQATPPIHGQILDMNRNPLVGVTIWVNQQKLYSDSEGHFTLKSKLNKGNFNFSAIGYKSKTQYLEASERELTILLLEQKPEIRQQP